MTLKISIITPNFNYANYLPKLFESIISQSYKNWEHIIVDDGSTDNSIDVINHYINSFPDKIKLIEQKNHGQTKALNKALQYVSGDIIGWLNSDDLFAENVFENVIKTFEKSPKADAVQGDIDIINPKGELIKRNKYIRFNYASGVFVGFGKEISSNAVFWKKELTDETGLFNEEFSFAMDSDYWARLLFKRNIIKTNFVFAKFRWHEIAKTIIRQDSESPQAKRAAQEDFEIYSNSYKKLMISRIVPIQFAKPIRILFKIRRYFLRFINGHYF